MTIGMPYNGPREPRSRRSRSSASASSSARGLTAMIALSIGPPRSYASIRARYASTSARDVTAPEASASFSSAILFSATSKAIANRYHGSWLPFAMPPQLDLRASLLAAWRTNNRVTTELLQRLPRELWNVPVPGATRRTIRTIAAHLHNSRCGWIKTLGREHGLTEPARVDAHRVTTRQLVAALKRSSAAMEALLDLGLAAGGSVPPSKGYVWRNLALDVGHVLTYFVAHEAHHRGQIVMIARQTGHRLPPATTAALWQWKP